VIALSTFNTRLRPAIQRLDRFSLRERTLVFLGGVALIYSLWQTLLMDPLLARKHEAELRLSGAQEKIVAVEQSSVAVEQDPALSAMLRNKALQQRIEALNHELELLAQGYVSPAKMTEMLRAMLESQRGLRLVSLMNLPPKSLAQPAPTGAGAGSSAAQDAPVAPAESINDSGPFLHPVEIVVEGDYLSMLNYLHELEKLPYQLHWDRVEVDVRDFPNNRVRIVVGALSLSRQWIIV
jgi:MSHA biogenesis protein MshJ